MRSYHVSSAVWVVMLAVLIASCKKDDTTTAPTPSPTLAVGQGSFTFHIGDSASTTVSGGTPPYTLVDRGDTTRVMPSLSGSRVSFRALAVGSSTIIVGDSSSPMLRASITVVVTVAPLVANPTGVTLSGTTPQSVTISTGTPPYGISQAPAASLATAHFADSTLTSPVLIITGVSTATGSTSVVVRDASSPQRSVTVGISKVQ